MSDKTSENIPTPSNMQSSEKTPTHTESHPIQITTIKLNGDNFLRWSRSVRMYVRGRGKMGYLIGDKTEPAKTDPTWAVWDAENSTVMTWLVNSMEEEIGANYMCFPYAKELWDSVNQMYSDLGNQFQIYELKLQLSEIRQGDDTVTKYFNVLRRLWQDLDLFNNYEWRSVEDFQHRKEVTEADRIFKFLAGLRNEFDEVRGRILGRQPFPPIGEVFYEVRREESRRSVMLGKPNTEAKAPAGGHSDASALVGSEANVGKLSSTTRRIDEKPRVWCDHCNRPRHTRETCWKIHGKPASSMRGSKMGSRTYPSANEAETNPFSREQIDHLLQLLKSNSVQGKPTASIVQKGADFGEDD
ncbi:uncharacterized protein LOC115755880 [Rhodamnia argentea]|uniref:Uncharacterized protein LOC115755880 n=1 Tax=Rhodamnia argentea TaxID=178133 RepID=A0A8B8QVU3_9MYRT|nr:uncharacterized protein LOC115755880 [Rhodamnia argentea]